MRHRVTRTTPASMTMSPYPVCPVGGIIGSGQKPRSVSPVSVTGSTVPRTTSPTPRPRTIVAWPVVAARKSAPYPPWRLALRLSSKKPVWFFVVGAT